MCVGSLVARPISGVGSQRLTPNHGMSLSRYLALSDEYVLTSFS